MNKITEKVVQTFLLINKYKFHNNNSNNKIF